MFGRATIRLGIGPHSSFIYSSKNNRILQVIFCYTVIGFQLKTVRKDLRPLTSI